MRWYMEEQLGGMEHSEIRPKPKISRGLATVAELESNLQLWMETQYRNYCECNRRERPFKFERATIPMLSSMVGKNKSTVSDALEVKKDIGERRYAGLAVLWEASQTWETTLRYGQKHFGAPGRR